MPSLFVKLEDFEAVKQARIDPIEGDKWQMIEEGNWISDGTYDIQKSVVKCTSTGKYYKYTLNRTGSYSSGHHYTHEDAGGVNLHEVIPVEKTVVITEWKLV